MSWPALLVTFGSLFTLACGSSTEPTSIGEPVELSSGQSVQVATARVTFQAVTGDSRCPSDVVCVWQGDATAMFQVERAQQTETTVLHTAGPTSAPVGDLVMELVDVKPVPRSNQPIPPGSYRVVVRFSRPR